MSGRTGRWGGEEKRKKEERYKGDKAERLAEAIL